MYDNGIRFLNRTWVPRKRCAQVSRFDMIGKSIFICWEQYRLELEEYNM